MYHLSLDVTRKSWHLHPLSCPHPVVESTCQIRRQDLGTGNDAIGLAAAEIEDNASNQVRQGENKYDNAEMGNVTRASGDVRDVPSLLSRYKKRRKSRPIKARAFFKDAKSATMLSRSLSLPQLRSDAPAERKRFRYEIELASLRPVSGVGQLKYEMPDHSKPYNYMPLAYLNSVRLVELLLGETEKSIHCKIIHKRLSNHPDYEALSYTWGDPSDVSRVFGSGRRLYLTRNLRAALLHLRHANKLRTLWIDAISINQEDLDERSQQVRLMFQIYGAARQTVVWPR